MPSIKECVLCIEYHDRKDHCGKLKKCCKCLKHHIKHIIEEYTRILNDQNTMPQVSQNMVAKSMVKCASIPDKLLNEICASKMITSENKENNEEPENTNSKTNIKTQTKRGSVQPLNIVDRQISYPIYSPNDLVRAYDMHNYSNRGDGQIITIVIAYHYQYLIDSLTNFKAAYLPSYPSPQVEVVEMYNVYLNGTNLTKRRWAQNTKLNTYRNASVTSGWYLEECMDLQMVYAMAPFAKIRVICALSDSMTNINDAVQYAINYRGATNNQPFTDIISMSFGIYESSLTSTAVSTYAPFYRSTTRSLSLLASVGDASNAIAFPSDLPNILSIGGTALFMNNNGTTTGGGSFPSQGIYSINLDSDNTYELEYAWSGSSGGISRFATPVLPKPSYQNNVSIYGTNVPRRATPDVAAVADPNTGAIVYTRNSTNTANVLNVLGGTSLSCPIWAGILAVINQQRANLSPAKSPLHTNVVNNAISLHNVLYTDPASNEFRDIKYGYSGINVTDSGYDLITGLGTPCNALYTYLINY